VLEMIAELAAEGNNFEAVVSKLLQEVETHQESKSFCCSALGAVKVAFQLRAQQGNTGQKDFARKISGHLVAKSEEALLVNGLFVEDDIVLITSQILSVITASQQDEYYCFWLSSLAFKIELLSSLG